MYEFFEPIANFLAPIVFPLGILEIITRVLFKFSILHPIWYTIYTIYLILQNRVVVPLFKALISIINALKKTKKTEVSRPREIPPFVSRWPHFFSLKPGQVIIGLDIRKRPIKMDLTGVHTLVSGLTRSGKSIFLHSVLTQCVAMGQQFLSSHALYILDLKGDIDDSFDVWEPVCEGYFRRGREDAGIDGAIELMREIHSRLHDPTDRRKVVVLIDELMSLDTKKASQVFGLLSSQIASVGGIVATTQTAHYTVIDTKSRNNFWQRICFPVADIDHAKLALARRPKKEELPVSEGDFLASLKGDLKKGKSPLPDPEEREAVVKQAIERMRDSDDRIKMYMEVAYGLKKGESLPGIKRVSANVEWIDQTRLNNLYRNLDVGGIAKYNKPGRGGRFVMQMSFAQGLSKLRRFIKSDWSEDVAPVAEMEIE